MTRLSAWLRSPNTIASAGHACSHAVSMTPSAMPVPSVLASMRAWLMRCTQYVHFSMTPRLRIVTSGLRCAKSSGVVEILVQQEVEAPDLVRAVVRAIPRADAAVVDHVVQAFVAVHRRRHRADHFARRVLALLTRQRLVIRGLARVGSPSKYVSTRSQCISRLRLDLRLADDRDVVFRHARRDADAAAGAGVEVDRHAPRCAAFSRAG